MATLQNIQSSAWKAVVPLPALLQQLPISYFVSVLESPSSGLSENAGGIPIDSGNERSKVRAGVGQRGFLLYNGSSLYQFSGIGLDVKFAFKISLLTFPNISGNSNFFIGGLISGSVDQDRRVQEGLIGGYQLRLSSSGSIDGEDLIIAKVVGGNIDLSQTWVETTQILRGYISNIRVVNNRVEIEFNDFWFDVLFSVIEYNLFLQGIIYSGGNPVQTNSLLASINTPYSGNVSAGIVIIGGANMNGNLDFFRLITYVSQ